MTSEPRAGRFIVFEGLDGSGQTTQAKLLVEWFHTFSFQAEYTKEPTEGPVGQVLRSILSRRLVVPAADLVPSEATMALLFAADRTHHLQATILPLLRSGVHVVADRYVASSLAYQSANHDEEWVRSINRHAQPADVTFYLRVEPAVAMQRIAERSAVRELYEDSDRLARVARNYDAAIRRLQSEGQRVVVLDGHRSRAEIHGEIITHVRADLPDRASNAGLSPLSAEEITAYLQSH